MKIIEISDWEYQSKMDKSQKKIVNELEASIRSKITDKYLYGCDKTYRQEILYYVNTKLNQLISVGIKSFEGKSFLDLGCGNTGFMDYGGGDMFRPWLCRTLTELGAKRVIGVDIGKNKDKTYEVHRADLTKMNCLNFLETASINVATSFNLFDSPDFYGEWDQRFVNGDLYFWKLNSQLKKIVKPDGLFVHDYPFADRNNLTNCCNYSVL